MKEKISRRLWRGRLGTGLRAGWAVPALLVLIGCLDARGEAPDRPAALTAKSAPTSGPPLVCVLDDFDDEAAPNDFFGGQGPWVDKGSIAASYRCDDFVGPNGCSLAVDYDVTAAGSHAAFWEQFAYNDLDGNVNPTYDLSEFDELHFWVAGEATYTSRLYLELMQDPTAGGFKKADVEITGITGAWQEKVVNLRAVTGLDWARMKQLAFRFDNGHVDQPAGRILIDELHFVDLDGGCAAPEECLDLFARRGSKYLKDFMHPTSGLIRDRAADRTVSSVAADRFGLTGLCIAAKRGWVPRPAAAGLARRMLETLWSCPQGPEAAGVCGYKGFFYHMLAISTGARDGVSELSSVDTAILMAGVITAGRFFDDPADPDETAIRSLADALYGRVEWDWMVDPQGLFHMAWAPESGFSPSLWDSSTRTRLS